MRAPLLLAVPAALLALAGCGRVGPVHPAGPQGAIIYPRLYPYIPPATAPATSTTEERQAPAERGDTSINRPATPR